MVSPSPIRRIVGFGVFEIDVQERELRKSGLKVKLRDQSFELLAALLERPGELVTRDELRSKLWPADTFVDFDHSLNAAIKRLRDALGDDPDNPQFIETVPRRGYRFLAQVTVPGSGRAEILECEPAAPLSARLLRFPVAAVVLSLAIAVVLGLGALLYTPPTPSAKPAMRTTPLTTSLGAKFQPAFSGDGEEVAYVWDGNSTNRTDVYIKRIGTERPLQLTRSSGYVCCPGWSSDNRYVAFFRCSGEHQGIYQVPSLGGPERRLREMIGCGGLASSPTEQMLVFSEKPTPESPYALFRISLGDLQPHQITFPTGNIVGDQDPSFSPDGNSVAFIRIVGEGTPDVYTVPTSGGVARRLTFDKRFVAGVAWTADGKEIVFSSSRDGGQALWILPITGGEPRRLALGGAAAFNPAISRKGDRLTYTEGDVHPNLWVIDLAVRGAKEAGRPQPFVSSAIYNNSPRFSPDGKTVAFASKRSGEMEIWTCAATDCSEPQQLTFLKSLSGTPRWSPDGRKIVFESRPHGHSQILVVSAEGGEPAALTDGKAEDKVASWSADGKFVYFSSNRSGQSQIWKIPLDGGQPSQITQHGGFAAFESSDARYLYYVKEHQPGLWRMTARGGAEIKVYPLPLAERWGDWALFDKGIYFLTEAGPRPAIEFLDFATRNVSKIAEVESLPPPGDPGFTVSPDEKRFIFSEVDRSSVEIMLVENFRDAP
jgi:Tol biopolymer transport system component/DNA-binding winged helix-turn-helix (wHTH) protein